MTHRIPRAPRIGLEVHVRLATASKLFCACPSVAGGAPNRATCPVCVGLPGAMPTLNRRAVELALFAALTLDCTIAPFFAFDRKHYAYPDLPKGYQTTQAHYPIATGGALELSCGRRIALVGLHIEDDAGRSRHSPGATHVDLNRAGAPLIEIVTKPELHNGDEVRDFLVRLREELRFSGVSDGDMEKGSLRCDVNVSLAPRDTLGFARVELKNLNSIRAADEAVSAEFERQERLLVALELGRGPGPTEETRGWHTAGQRSFPTRAKEQATDYRFLPEPDLPGVRIEASDIAAARASLPEGPAAIRARWQADFGLDPASAMAQALTLRPWRAAYFDAAVAAGAPQLLTANWILNELVTLGPTVKSQLPASTLAQLLALLANSKLSRAGAQRVLAELLHPNPPPPQAIAQRLGLLSTEAKPALLERLVRATIVSCPEAAADFTAGNPKALDALVGAVMRTASGRLDGRGVRQALSHLLTKE